MKKSRAPGSFQEPKHILRKCRDVARRNRRAQRGSVNVTSSRSNALPMLAYRKSRAASRWQFLLPPLPSRFAKRSIPLSFVAKKEKQKAENKTLAGETRERNRRIRCFLLTFLAKGKNVPRAIIPSLHLPHSDTPKWTRSKLVLGNFIS